MRTIRVMLALGLTIADATGCGSKTGLFAPDAGHDAGMDAGVTESDAGTVARCIDVEPSVGRVLAELSLPASLAVVDIMFLVDATGSMRDEIDAVRRGLRDRVVPSVRELIPDAAFGVAFFGEFPRRPHGPSSVRPYELRSPMTLDVPRVEAALDNPASWGNFDDPEATVEGLYQVLTGEGYGRPADPGFIAPSLGCPTGGSGGACFRPDALPVVMIVTDAPMHNGPPGIAPRADYRFAPPPHTYQEVLNAVARSSTLLLGLGATDRGRPSPAPHLNQLLVDAASVDVLGRPLYFDIGSGGDRIGGEIVTAVQRVAEGVPLDVDAVVEDLPGDGVDATPLLRGVVAIRADPPGNVRLLEQSRFVGVAPGTLLTFGVDIDVTGLPPASERRVYPARVVFRASGRSRLQVETIDIVVPGQNGGGCP